MQTSWKFQYVGFKTLFVKECQRFFKVAGQTIISPLISTTLYLLIFGVNLGERISDQNGVNYLQFIIPGLVALGLLNNAYQNAASSVIISKFHGDLQDLKVVPLSPRQIIWAYALAGTMRGMLIGLAIILVGQGFYLTQYGTLLGIEHFILMMVFVLMGGMTFSLLGLSVAIYASNFDQVNAVGTFVILPLIYLGGLFFSIENMHWFWKSVSYANPLLYVINGIRFSFLGVSDIHPVIALPTCLCFVVLTYVLARRAVRKGSYTRF